jgi:hypothetical protein
MSDLMHCGVFSPRKPNETSKVADIRLNEPITKYENKKEKKKERSKERIKRKKRKRKRKRKRRTKETKL